MTKKVQTTLRMTEDLKSQLEVMAEHNFRSFNAEIIRILQKEVQEFRKQQGEKQKDLFS